MVTGGNENNLIFRMSCGIGVVQNETTFNG